MFKMEQKTRYCCEKCAPCWERLKKVDGLQNSGLKNYLKKYAQDQELENTDTTTFNDTNTTKEFIREFCHHGKKCSTCKTIMGRAQSLLDEIAVIKDQNIVGICEHCKRATTTAQCKKCRYILVRYLAEQENKKKETQDYFRQWLLKVRNLLQAILSTHSICQQMMCKDVELENILKQLKAPLDPRLPDVNMFPDIREDKLASQTLTESKEMLEELLSKIQPINLNERFASVALSSSTSNEGTCICKLIKAGHFVSPQPIELQASNTDKDIIQRLKDFGTMLTEKEFKNIDKKLIDQYIKTVNLAENHCLLQETIKTLLEQLIQLKQGLNDEKTMYKILGDLIRDLEKLVQNVHNQILLVLANVCKEQSCELSKDLHSKLMEDIATQTAKDSPKLIFSKDLTKKDAKAIGQRDSSTKVKDGKSKGLSKNISQELAQKLTNLTKELNKGVIKCLNKNLVQKITCNLKELMVKEPPHITKQIVDSVIDLCKIVSQDLPKDVNYEHIQDILGRICEGFPHDSALENNKQLLLAHLKDLIDALRGRSNKTVSKLSAKSKVQDENKDKKQRKESKKISEPKEAKESSKTTSKLSAKSKVQDENKDKKQPKESKKRSEPKEAKEPKKSGKSKCAIKVPKKSSEDALLQKMFTVRTENKTKDDKKKDADTPKDRDRMMKALAGLGGLPELKKPVLASLPETESQATLICHVPEDSTPYAILGNSIVHKNKCKKRSVTSIDEHSAQLKKQIAFEELPELQTNITTHTTSSKTSPKISPAERGGGILRYELSNREFINKGWTKLPTKKIMRSMHIYKMEPVNPELDWFERHKYENVLYDTGEILAQTESEKNAKLFYKDGSVALEYYKARDTLAGQRYIVYSTGEELDHGKHKSKTILALFDFLGNGVVYDYNGNVRLKYNQSDGQVIDPKIGPPSRWKWHKLNDPPVLKEVYFNQKMCDPDIEKLGTATTESKKTHDAIWNENQAAMTQIEFENFVKEKMKKMNQKFKPFQIRMKTVKLNDHFALRIMEQSNISLVFRDGATSLKLNLGLQLNNLEIVDTDYFDMADVVTPYDLKSPAKSESVAKIQQTLKTIKTLNKKHP